MKEREWKDLNDRERGKAMKELRERKGNERVERRGKAMKELRERKGNERVEREERQ